MFPPDAVNSVRIGSLLLALVSAYTLAFPERFGMRLGMSYVRMPHAPVGKVLGILGLTVAGGCLP
jgi:hypothetical protein